MPVTDTPAPVDQEPCLADWLRLQATPGIGPATGRRLLGHFGLPGAIFKASRAALQHVVPPTLATQLCAPPDNAVARQVDAALVWLEQPGNQVLTLADTAYPRALLEIADPPLLLYIKGDASLLARPALAMVGSRNASAQGQSNAETFARALSQAGLTIVSGLALGIDAAAHRGALAGPGGTVAVIATGADLVYPGANRALAHRIAEQGCIVSEYALGQAATRAHFPRRNRLISGLAQGVLVVEAAARSGSLITAGYAAEQGRDVFAVPGSIHSTLAKGCHGLIKQGAKLVECAEDVLQEMPGWALAGQTDARPGAAPQVAVPEQHGAWPAAPPDQHGDALLAALGHDPAGVDLLAERSGLDAAGVMSGLLQLELAGRIERLPGGLYQRCSL